MKILLWLAVLVLVVILMRLSELYTQLARYKTYWRAHNEQTLANSKPENIRYYALGDSAAQGVGATSPKKGYVRIIADELEKKTGKKIELINLSKSGATIRDGIEEQIPEMETLGVNKDTIVTIEIGANDIKSFEPEKFENDMNKLMAKLPDQTIISDIPSFLGSINKKYEKNVQDANVIIRRLVDEHGLKRALLYDRVLNNHGIGTFAADLFHPSNKGYRENWARAFVEQLDK